ncbi:uncharacterized protein LOC127901763 [Citrus sinensis]|uniref:uncharacterized protein LOC127901763 n=1 Tax=Citrus sinensis TaxID=2711 RepID=UPI002279069C|nr:uncharacterized protein LOC127901763 [Citrus sinensis]
MASPAMAGGHPATSLEFPPLPSFAQMAAKPPTAQPCKSFVDAAVESQRAAPAIAFRQSSTHRGEPAIFFSEEEINIMAAPFKLALVGKFSFGRPPIDVIRKFFVALGLKGNCEISLLDPRHILIHLHLEEDYTRIWLRQSWFIDGRAMRVFKWSTTFHSSEESPIVPVWVSLPFLPVHYMRCKEALYSIAAAIGKPLRIDHATAAVSRPTVARVLIEYDISRPLLKRLWIGEKDTGFWQYIIFEKVPRYCAACKHVGHSDDSCYINKPELRKADRVGPVQQPVVPDGERNKTKAPMKTQYVQKADNRTQNTVTNVAATVLPPVVHNGPTTSAETREAQNDVPPAKTTQVAISDPPAVADIPPLRTVTQPSVVCASSEPTCSDLVPAVTSADSTAITPTPLAALLPLSGDHAARVGTTAGDLIYRATPAWDPYRHQGRFYRSSSWQTVSSCDTFPDITSTEVLTLPYAPYDAAPICTLNTESTDVPEVSPAPTTSKDRIGTSHRIEDYSNSSDDVPVDVRIGISDSEIMEETVIAKLGGQRIVTSTEGFTEVTPRKGFKMNRRRRRY